MDLFRFIWILRDLNVYKGIQHDFKVFNKFK